MRPLNFGKFLEGLERLEMQSLMGDRKFGQTPIKRRIEKENGKTNNPAALTAAA